MKLPVFRFSAAVLHAMGIPVLQEVLSSWQIPLEVAEACSGFSIALSVVFAYLRQETTIRRVILIIFYISYCNSSKRIQNSR